jgi:GH15 family glucan-1,4-alpha-glucosidase
MTQAIEDYAVIGNCETVALVGRNGSIDWLGFPRYDSSACFAALLGTEENGRWLIAPANGVVSTKRRYREGTAVLETEFTTAEGSILLIDCLDRSPDHSDVLRLVRGLRGRVAVHLELVLRFEYGLVVPWVSRMPDGRVRAVAGPDQLILSASVKLEGRDLKTVANFTVTEGQEVPFSLRWSQSFHSIPSPPEVSTSIEHCDSLMEEMDGSLQNRKPLA